MWFCLDRIRALQLWVEELEHGRARAGHGFRVEPLSRLTLRKRLPAATCHKGFGFSERLAGKALFVGGSEVETRPRPGNQDSEKASGSNSQFSDRCACPAAVTSSRAHPDRRFDSSRPSARRKRYRRHTPLNINFWKGKTPMTKKS